MLVLAAAVRLTSPGPAIHWSRRVGRRGTESSRCPSSVRCGPTHRTSRRTCWRSAALDHADRPLPAPVEPG
ncbi:MAG: hypothetical protein QM775_32620 [Pirellulales bacterium]